MRGNPNMEWIVTPPALIAATPVGATTTTFLLVCSTIRFSSVVFPVPAFPVNVTSGMLVRVSASMAKVCSAFLGLIP